MNDNYFAGLIDSDFGITITRFYPRGNLQLRPQICFVNTNFVLIEACSNHLLENNINHHVRSQKATKGRDRKVIEIKRLSKCSDFSKLWTEQCVVRKPQLKVLRKFCESRLSYVRQFGWKQNNTPYTDYQKSLYDDIIKLNLNYNYDAGYRNKAIPWLAGIIDGDGSICFVISKDRIIPTVSITTGSDMALVNIKDIYDSLEVHYNVQKIKSKASKKLGRNKTIMYYNINVRDQKSIHVLCSSLEDYLLGKNKQCSLMLEYLKVRSQNQFYTDTCWSIAEEVKALNRLGHLRD
jgi:hypothetical protein